MQGLNFNGGASEVFAIDIAECDDLDSAGFKGGFDIDHPPPAAADETQFNHALGGGRGRGRGQIRSWGGFRIGGLGAEGGEGSRAECGGT